MMEKLQIISGLEALQRRLCQDFGIYMLLNDAIEIVKGATGEPEKERYDNARKKELIVTFCEVLRHLRDTPGIDGDGFVNGILDNPEKFIAILEDYQRMEDNA